MLNEKIDIDITGITQLKISLVGDWEKEYGFGNPVLEK